MPGAVPIYRPQPKQPSKKPIRKGNKVVMPSGAVVTLKPKPNGKFGPIRVGGVKKPKPPTKPKVVAGPPMSTVTRPPTTGSVTGPKPTVTKPKGGPRPKTGKGGTARGQGTGSVTKAPDTTPKAPSVGFDPKKMAQTMTDLGYDADLAEIQRQIDANRGSMAEALKDLEGWASQIEDQHGVDSAATNAAWDQAQQQAAASDANIAGLFGGAAGGEAAAYSGAGEDYLSALGASDKAFNSRMYGILGAQQQDYNRRASNAFNAEQYELQAKQRDLQSQKGQAYQKNLLELMDMAWGRQQDIMQNQVAQEALEQSRAMAGIDLQKGQQDVKAGTLEIKSRELALKKSQIELKKLLQNPNGVNWNDPATRSQIGNAAFSGAISPRNTFMVNPKIALENAQIALAQMGLAGDPRANAAMWAAFRQILNFSHAHRQWGQWRINKQGQLVLDPTKKFKKNK